MFLAGIMPEQLTLLSCERCGGSYSLTALEPVVVCPYCRNQQVLPETVLAGAANYAHQAAVENERARLQRAIALRYEAMAPTAWFGLFIWALVAGGTLAVVSMTLLGGGEGITMVGAASGAVILLLPIVGFALISLTHRAKRARARKDFETRCPSCGGDNRLEIGQVVATCRYCSVALVPGERVAAEGLGLAAANTRAERLGAAAASRQFRVGGERRRRVLGAASAATSPVLPAVIAVFSYRQYQEGLAEWSQVMAAAVATILLFLAPLFLQAFRGLRNRAMSRTMAAFAGRPGHAELDGIAGTVYWLNGYWFDEWGSYYDLQPRGGYRAVAGSQDGFPFMISWARGQYLRITIAATAAPNKVRDARLAQVGFQIERFESGVVATLRGKNLGVHAGRCDATALGEWVLAAVRATHVAGGRPAARM
jgi:DNA-directed RNA polymerase subunit RPC12/RpoP